MSPGPQHGEGRLHHHTHFAPAALAAYHDAVQKGLPVEAAAMAARHVMKAVISGESAKEAASAGQAVAQSYASAVKSGLPAAGDVEGHNELLHQLQLELLRAGLRVPANGPPYTTRA